MITFYFTDIGLMTSWLLQFHDSYELEWIDYWDATDYKD